MVYKGPNALIGNEEWPRALGPNGEYVPCNSGSQRYQVDDPTGSGPRGIPAAMINISKPAGEDLLVHVVRQVTGVLLATERSSWLSMVTRKNRSSVAVLMVGIAKETVDISDDYTEVLMSKLV